MVTRDNWKKTTELKTSNRKTKGNRLDFEIVGLLRLYLVRNIKGPLCSEIPCLVACSLGTWSLLIEECDCSTIRAIFSYTNITERAIPIYRGDYLPTITSQSLSQTKFRNAGSSQRQGSGVKEPRCVDESCCATHRLTERSHCGSVEFSSGWTTTVFRDLYKHER